MKRIISMLCGLISLAACTPRLAAPVVDVPRGYRFIGSFSADSPALLQRWWELFGDTTLNRLVERALEQNKDLQISLSRVAEAREQIRSARAEYLPSVAMETSAEADYNRTQKITQQYGLTPTLSWEIPLFGQLRHATMAARSAWQAEVWNHRGVELSLAAEVATAYFTLRQYERDLTIARTTFRLRSETAALIDSMYRYGMSSGVDREQSYGLVYSAQADIPRYRSAIDRMQLSLNLLLGDIPQQEVAEGDGVELLVDSQPANLPVGIPSELLQRRPDLMEAYYTLQQAAAEAGVARSVRFPSISLTASGGFGSEALKELARARSAVWSVTGSIVKPIFNFGALRSEERQAVERYNQAALSYEQAVLTAFSEVEDALSQIEANRAQVDRYGELVDSYQQIVMMAHALYRSGMVNYLDLIDAERTLYTAQMQWVDLLAQQYINYVSLCKALGGGW